MKTLQACIDSLCEQARHPARTVKAACQATGKPAVGCFPLFVPEELVYAAGFLPVGLWGGVSAFQKADQYIQSFACSIIRANLELGMSGAYNELKAVLIPSQCDTLKCVCENFKPAVPQVPVIGVTIPNNRTIQAAHQQLLDEFDYITEQLTALQTPACQPMPLEEAFAVYEDYRSVMAQFRDIVPDYLNTITPAIRHNLIKAAWFLDKKDYTAQMRELLAALQRQPKETFQGTRCILTGIMLDAEPVLELLQELHIAVVDDLLCHESLFPRTPTRQEGSVSSRLAQRFLDLKGASPLYDPGKPRGQMLAELAKARGADLVFFTLMKFCDPEAFDHPFVKADLKAAGVPLLSVEHDQLLESAGQLRTRIQGFLEINFPG